MYRILIADDDKLIREDILSLIDWEKQGFVIAAQASNGQEALDILNNDRIDIVITDIYMPIIDGVELIKTAKPLYPDIEFIVISNYDDFVFVKDAMKYGACDYILKYEIDQDNFTVLLENFKTRTYEKQTAKIRVENIIESNEKYFDKWFWERIGSHLGQTGGIDIKHNEGCYIPILVEFELKDKIKIYNEFNYGNYPDQLPVDEAVVFQNVKEHYSAQLNKNTWLILFGYKEKSFLYINNECLVAVKSFAKEVKGHGQYESFIVVGNICLNVFELEKNISVIRQCMEERFYAGYGNIVNCGTIKPFAEEIKDELLTQVHRNILECVNNNCWDDLIACIDELVKRIKIKRYKPSVVYKYMYQITIEINMKMEEKCPNTDVHKVISYESFKSINTIDVMKIYFVQMLKSLSTEKGRYSYVTRGEIRKAVEYINANYVRDITLNDLAENVGLSRNYLCRLFKEETGENFIDFLNKLRVKKAKIILAGGNTKTYEVAMSVGINDYRYFCRIFRNITGMRPNEYKKTSII